jgi:predicted amidohydrolase
MKPVLLPSLRVMAVQYEVLGGQSLASFMLRVEDSVKQAVLERASLLVLPELHSLDLIAKVPESDASQLRSIAERYFESYRDGVESLSKKYGISILAGTFPRPVDQGVRNTAILSLADGRSFLQDKLFLTPDEKLWGWSPGDVLNIIETPWGPTAILICFDSEIPALTHKLVKEAPDLVLVPSMTGPTGFYRVRWSAKSQAIEHHVPVIHSGTVGGTRGRKEFFGSAAIILPQDTPYPRGLAAESLADKPGWVIFDLPLELIRARRLEFDTVHPAREERERTAPISIERIKSLG